MYYAPEQPALKPSASQNPLSASEPWNFVADAQTLFGTLRAIKPDLPQPQRSITKAFPTRSTGEFLDFMVKGCAPIQTMKKGLGEERWREKKKLALAWLKETLPALEGTLTSGAWLGMGVK